MKNFLHKQREIFAILSYLAVVAILVWLVIFPMIDRIDSINNQTQEENAKQESIKKQITDLPRIQKQYEALQNGQNLNDVLLDKNQAVVLIEKLEKLAEKTGNTISMSIQDNPIAATDPKKSSAKGKNEVEKSLIEDLPSDNFLQMKISVEGNYDSIFKFVRSLEDFEYYADVVSLQIVRSDESGIKKSSMPDALAVNPFSQGDLKNLPEKEAPNDLISATLETVFYTKK